LKTDTIVWEWIVSAKVEKQPNGERQPPTPALRFMWGETKKVFLKDAWKATMYFCCFLCCFVLLAPQIKIEKKGK